MVILTVHDVEITEGAIFFTVGSVYFASGVVAGCGEGGQGVGGGWAGCGGGWTGCGGGWVGSGGGGSVGSRSGRERGPATTTVSSRLKEVDSKILNSIRVFLDLFSFYGMLKKVQYFVIIIFVSLFRFSHITYNPPPINQYFAGFF